MIARLALPQKTIYGDSALEDAGADLRALGTRALIVTGPHVSKSGALSRLQAVLDGAGVGYAVFDGITGEPDDGMIATGVAAFRESGSDFLIGLGGGSPLDSAKAIAAMAVLPGEPYDYMGKEIEGSFAPLALIPTTAGTGSESTRFTVITDRVRGIKMLLKGPALLPALAIVDPTLGYTAPASVTAATGMDALTHAVESYTSRRANPLTDALALDATARIFAHLGAACRDGGNATARAELAFAAYAAGICINNSSVTLVHGMSRPIGALFHVPHGIANAMLMRTCLGWAVEGCPERFAALARAISAVDGKAGDNDAAAAFLDALDALCTEVSIPTLAAYGVPKESFFAAIDKMAGDALASGSPGNTRRSISKADIVELYQKLW